MPEYDLALQARCAAQLATIKAMQEEIDLLNAEIKLLRGNEPKCPHSAFDNCDCYR